MAKTIIRGQMAKIVKQDTIERNGQKITVVYFSVADRSQTSHKNTDGTVDYRTKGFYFCKAYGAKAEYIIRNFTAVDENGKLISRAIYLETEPQFYNKDRVVNVKMDIPADKLFEAFGLTAPEGKGGVIVTVEKPETIVTRETVYVVKDVEPDDYKVKPVSAVNEVSIRLADASEETPMPSEEDYVPSEDDITL